MVARTIQRFIFLC